MTTRIAVVEDDTISREMLLAYLGSDVFDALTSKRPYKPAWPNDRAIAYIREQSGKHFDPYIVESFLRVLPQIVEIQETTIEIVSGS